MTMRMEAGSGFLRVPPAAGQALGSCFSAVSVTGGEASPYFGEPSPSELHRYLPPKVAVRTKRDKDRNCPSR